MNDKEFEAFHRRCRAPFTDGWGNSTLPKPQKADKRFCELLSEITASVPESHKQDFIRLQRKIFGLKLISTEDSAS